ncbi:MAG: hypothetical protein ACRYGF_19140 [Janthinobacterium lividum]
MAFQDRLPDEFQQRLAAERGLQVGAALLLGLLVLVGVVLRAGTVNIFPPGWWRHW